MRRSDWPVGNDQLHPEDSPDRCMRCHQSLGSQHSDGCIVRSRSVVVRFSFDITVMVPEDWDAGNIEFFYDGSSHCANNIVSDLEERVERSDNAEEAGETSYCLCGQHSVQYLREATESDESRDLLFVSEEAS